MVQASDRYVSYMSAGVEIRRPIREEGEPGWVPTFEEIPVISFKRINGSLEERKELAEVVGKACRDVGFFYAKDVDLPPTLIADTFKVIEDFFALPEEEKMTAHWHKSPACRGYEPFSESRLGTDATKDIRESISIGDDYLDEEQNYQGVVPTGTKPQNCWPATFPRLREGLYEYYSHVYPWARQLLRILALALGLDEDAFEEQHTFPITGMRALHYPPQEAEEDTPGLIAHSDFSLITMLLQQPGSKPALDVLNLNGKWISAPPIDGAAFTCNIGDFLEVASNKTFVSTVHRVLNNGNSAPRYSLPFFFSPDPDAVIEPLPAFLSKEGPKFPPMLVGQHYVRRVLNSRIHHPSAKLVRKHNIPMEKWHYGMMQGHGLLEEEL